MANKDLINKKKIKHLNFQCNFKKLKDLIHNR